MRKWQIALTTLAALYLLILTNTSAPPNPSLLISKSKNKLYIIQEGSPIDSVNCSFGYGEDLNPGPKTREGDGRTPEGEYSIIRKDQSESGYLYFMQIDYPNTRDASRGLEAKTIGHKDYLAITGSNAFGITPPQETHLGGYIGIHGHGGKKDRLSKIERGMNWTGGCIAVNDEDLRRIYGQVGVGSKVKIEK